MICSSEEGDSVTRGGTKAPSSRNVWGGGGPGGIGPGNCGGGIGPHAGVGTGIGMT
jgi:hypothetical protein